VTRGLAVVAASGGLDSCVAAAVAAREFDLAMLHVDYGQRTESKERACFERIADFYRVPGERRLDVRLAYLATIGGSCLTDESIPVPEAELHRKDVPVSYVPFRNAQILAAATAWAEALTAHRVFIGAVEEDSSGYPDCREVFIDAFNTLAALGCKPGADIRIVAPLVHLTKADIVRLGAELGAPFHLTWSCYRDEEVACGRCDSCLLRLRGFEKAGLADPIQYAADM